MVGSTFASRTLPSAPVFVSKGMLPVSITSRMPRLRDHAPNPEGMWDGERQSPGGQPVALHRVRSTPHGSFGIATVTSSGALVALAAGVYALAVYECVPLSPSTNARSSVAGDAFLVPRSVAPS